MRKDRVNGAVLAGYTIPVTLQKESKDKTPFDVGIFRQRIQLKTKGADPNQSLDQWPSTARSWATWRSSAPTPAR